MLFSVARYWVIGYRRYITRIICTYKLIDLICLEVGFTTRSSRQARLVLRDYSVGYVIFLTFFRGSDTQLHSARRSLLIRAFDTSSRTVRSVPSLSHSHRTSRVTDQIINRVT